MKTYRWVWFCLCQFMLLISCDLTGYHDLGEPVNGFEQLGTEAASYMRTQKTDQGAQTELFSISNIQKDDGTFAWLHVSEQPEVVIADLVVGTFKISKGSILLSYAIHYINRYEEKSNPSKTSGAVQYKLSSEDAETLSWHYNATSNIVELDGHPYQSTRLIYDAIFSQKSPDWTDQFMKMFLLGTLSAHCRIEGFGGIGMLHYMGKTTVFDGLLFGTLDLRSSGLREVTSKFAYNEYSDIPGIVLNGEMTNLSDMSGNGKLDGIVEFKVTGTSQSWQGQIDYSKIKVTHTQPSSGEYVILIDNLTYSADYGYSNPGNFDLTDIVDPDPETW